MRDEADLFVKEGQISPMRPTDKKYQFCVQQMKEQSPVSVTLGRGVLHLMMRRGKGKSQQTHPMLPMTQWYCVTLLHLVFIPSY